MVNNINLIFCRYPADEKLRQDILRDMPEEIEKELHSKSSELHNRLKDVSFYTSITLCKKQYTQIFFSVGL